MNMKNHDHPFSEKMRDLIAKRRHSLGQPPGTLIHVGERKTESVKITMIDYSKQEYTEKVINTVEESYPFMASPSVTWLNIDGLHNLEVFSELGKHFNIHPLMLEDMLNTEQRPKLEDFESYLFIILKMIYYNEKEEKIEQEQVSLILGPSFVISFQEKEGDVFDTIRDRIKKAKGRIRDMGTDFLAYSLIDAIVDSYFLVMENFGERLELLEDELLEDPSPSTSQFLHELKRELIFLRKSVWPLREIINSLARGDSRLVDKSTIIFLRDLYDHTVQVLESVELFREMTTGILETYLSSLSNKMNSTMKILTIIATIFIPLTFIVGIYGMNFNFIPELRWKWGYPVVWGLMLGIAGFMIIIFKRKKWI